MVGPRAVDRRDEGIGDGFPGPVVGAFGAGGRFGGREWRPGIHPRAQDGDFGGFQFSGRRHFGHAGVFDRGEDKGCLSGTQGFVEAQAGVLVVGAMAGLALGDKQGTDVFFELLGWECGPGCRFGVGLEVGERDTIP